MSSLYSSIMTDDDNAPYMGGSGRFSFGSTTWNSLRAGGANVYGRTTNQLIVSPGTPSGYGTLWRQTIAVDLTDFIPIGFTATAAAFYVRCTSKTYSGGAGWDDTDRGILLTSMDDATKAASTFAVTDYNAVGAGSYSQFTSTIPYSSVNSGGFNTLTFNSTGLAYLNGCLTKANYPGYAFFCLTTRGDADNTDPAFGAGENYQMYFNGADDAGYRPYFTMTYDSHIKINSSDSWGDVLALQVNISDVWKDVADVGVNISDAWKEIAV